MTEGLVKLRYVLADSVHKVGDVIERAPAEAKRLLGLRFYGMPWFEAVAEEEPKTAARHKPAKGE